MPLKAERYDTLQDRHYFLSVQVCLGKCHGLQQLKDILWPSQDVCNDHLFLE